MCFSRSMEEWLASYAYMRICCDAANAFGPRDELDNEIWFYDEIDNNLWRKRGHTHGDLSRTLPAGVLDSARHA